MRGVRVWCLFKLCPPKGNFVTHEVHKRQSQRSTRTVFVLSECAGIHVGGAIAQTC